MGNEQSKNIHIYLQKKKKATHLETTVTNVRNTCTEVLAVNPDLQAYEQFSIEFYK